MGLRDPKYRISPVTSSGASHPVTKAHLSPPDSPNRPKPAPTLPQARQKPLHPGRSPPPGQTPPMGEAPGKGMQLPPTARRLSPREVGRRHVPAAFCPQNEGALCPFPCVATAPRKGRHRKGARPNPQGEIRLQVGMGLGGTRERVILRGKSERFTPNVTHSANMCIKTG
jgi:hypothetical protein